MTRLFALCILLLLGTITAGAQSPPPPQENVTVTATKSREMLDKFAKAFTTPTKLTGKVARWEKGICPVAVGQTPAFTAFVTARVKAIAAAAGAPVSDLKSCDPNIEIVFTSTPQELLDNIRKKNPGYLGYAETTALMNQLAMVTRPIQAWYTTETIDLDGIARIDSARRRGQGITLSNFSPIQLPNSMGMNRDPFYLPDATYARVTGNHISDGARSGFNHIIIAVDAQKLAGQDFIPLTDYIAMLALAQLNSLDTCQQLPSIVNKLAPNCDQQQDGITATDLAYLHGLYQMGADRSLLFQQNDIANGMEATLGR
jgi:hypothetical protein